MRCLFFLSLLVPLTGCASSGSHTAGRPEESPAIIDVHVHVYDADPRWGVRAPNPATGQPLTATTEQAHRQATLAEMQRRNVVKAVVSNDYQCVLRWKAAAPDRIITAYGFSDPTQDDLDLIRREHAAGRLDALGEITAQYEHIAPDDPRMEPVYALAEELDLPVFIHIGLTKPGATYDVYPKYRAALSNPLALEEVLVRHPRLRICVMHAAWPMLDDMIALMWAHPQVYVDTGIIDWGLPRKEFHTYLRRLVEAGFGKRIMFGSDQMVWPEAIGIAIKGIESATFLTEDQKRDILHDNAVRFLRLGGE